MSEFIRVPSQIINLEWVLTIEFEGRDRVVLHYPLGQKRTLYNDDAAVFLDQLEQLYGLMTDPAARLYEEEPCLKP